MSSGYVWRHWIYWLGLLRLESYDCGQQTALQNMIVFGTCYCRHYLMAHSVAPASVSRHEIGWLLCRKPRRSNTPSQANLPHQQARQAKFLPNLVPFCD